MNDRKLMLGPPPTVIVFSIIAVAAGIFFLVWALRRAPQLTSFGIVLMGSAVLLFLLAGFDGLQRRYVIERSVIRKRILFLWRESRLPPDVEVKTSSAGQVLVKSMTDGRVIVTIPREYNRREALARELQVFLAESGSTRQS